MESYYVNYDFDGLFKINYFELDNKMDFIQD